jgi:hypothetical protein
MLPELGEPGQSTHLLGKLGTRSGAQMAGWAAVRHDPSVQVMGDPDERLGAAP